MRPCNHTEFQSNCAVCHWCQSPTEKGRAYRQLWGEPEPASTTPVQFQAPTIRRGSCKHLGKMLEEIAHCRACGTRGQTTDAFECALHEACTVKTPATLKRETGSLMIPCCATCPDWESKSKPVPPESPCYGNDPLDQIIVNRNGNWVRDPDTMTLYEDTLRLMIRRSYTPPSLQGDGVVICGGGRYWPMIVLSVHMLRKYSDLPVQIWYRGDKEPVREKDIARFKDVTLVDSLSKPHRQLNNFEMKLHAVTRCGWKRVLYLDADAYCTKDPQPLLDLVDTNRFVYWPIHYHDGPNVQGGQLVFDCQQFWKELCVAHWMNQHSDYWYNHVTSGDEGVLKRVLQECGSKFLCLPSIRWKDKAWSCEYPVGNTVVVHRCSDKIWLGRKPEYRPDVPHEESLFTSMKELGLLGKQIAYRRPGARVS